MLGVCIARTRLASRVYGALQTPRLLQPVEGASQSSGPTHACVQCGPLLLNAKQKWSLAMSHWSLETSQVAINSSTTAGSASGVAMSASACGEPSSSSSPEQLTRRGMPKSKIDTVRWSPRITNRIPGIVRSGNQRMVEGRLGIAASFDTKGNPASKALRSIAGVDSAWHAMGRICDAQDSRLFRKAGCLESAGPLRGFVRGILTVFGCATPGATLFERGTPEVSHPLAVQG